MREAQKKSRDTTNALVPSLKQFGVGVRIDQELSNTAVCQFCLEHVEKNHLTEDTLFLQPHLQNLEIEKIRLFYREQSSI